MRIPLFQPVQFLLWVWQAEYRPVCYLMVPNLDDTITPSLPTQCYYPKQRLSYSDEHLAPLTYSEDQ